MQLAPQRTACYRNSPIPGSLRHSFSGLTKYLVLHCNGYQVQLNGLSRTISIFLENKTYVCSLPILLVLVLLAEATPAVPPCLKHSSCKVLRSHPFRSLTPVSCDCPADTKAEARLYRSYGGWVGRAFRKGNPSYPQSEALILALAFVRSIIEPTPQLLLCFTLVAGDYSPHSVYHAYCGFTLHLKLPSLRDGPGPSLENMPVWPHKEGNATG